MRQFYCGRQELKSIRHQCDQIGRFLKVLGNKASLLAKNYCSYFVGNLRKNSNIWSHGWTKNIVENKEMCVSISIQTFELKFFRKEFRFICRKID